MQMDNLCTSWEVEEYVAIEVITPDVVHEYNYSHSSIAF